MNECYDLSTSSTIKNFNTINNSNFGNAQSTNQFNANFNNTSTWIHKLSNKNIKDFFNINQQDGFFRSYTQEFRKQRDNSVGRYVVQTNKLLITLDKLISIDLNVFTTENDRECKINTRLFLLSDFA
jgi:hypothetical protein